VDVSTFGRNIAPGSGWPAASSTGPAPQSWQLIITGSVRTLPQGWSAGSLVRQPRPTRRHCAKLTPDRTAAQSTLDDRSYLPHSSVAGLRFLDQMDPGRARIVSNGPLRSFGSKSSIEKGLGNVRVLELSAPEKRALELGLGEVCAP
jgi:hypothetical protein